ncbi:hypothetical protein ECC02_012849 [Trypanosoma cruzi]|uniref:Uncharacterized protein n=1 Tax=Trypanosoma cruzi TaxID=5693 RepID=A0A7J6XJC2_TRYCR|nr:hypothetical protein ECC02_012849 [Trypanosoma cruzi]
MNGGSQRHSLSISVCVFTHWTPNNPELSAALRNFASSCPHGCCTRLIVFERLLHHTLWSKFLFPIVNGGSQRHSLSISVCVFTHWTQNNPELSAAWRNFASSCPHGCCTRPIVFERLRKSRCGQILFPIVNGGSQEAVSCQYLFACSHTGRKQPWISRCLEEFRDSCPQGCCTRLIVFELLHHIVVQILFPIVNGGSQRDTLSISVCVFTHWTQTTLNYPLLGGISRALPTKGCCTRLIVFERPLHPYVIEVVNYRWSVLSLSISVCVFTHWTQNNPELSAAWRDFASSCPHGCCTRLIVFERLLHHTLWSKFLFPIVNGGSQRRSLSISVCVFTHWTPNEPELSAAWRNFASSCPHGCCTRLIVFERPLHHTLWSKFLFPIVNGGSQRHSLSISVCVFTHWTPNSPELSAAWRNFASSCPHGCCTRLIVFERPLHHTLWSEFLFPITNGGSQRHSLSISVCVFTHWTPNNPELSAAWRNFASSCPHGLLHSADRFRAAAASLRCGQILFPIGEWWESRRSLSISVACSHTGHQTTLNYPLLGEFRELLPTRVLHSADRFRAAPASHVVVQIFVSNYEWWESEALSVNICLRVHTLDTKQP